MKIIHVDYKNHQYGKVRKAFAVCSLEDYERLTSGEWDDRIHFKSNWNGILSSNIAGQWYYWLTPSRNTFAARASFDSNWRRPLWPKDELGEPVDFCILASSVKFRWIGCGYED